VLRWTRCLCTVGQVTSVTSTDNKIYMSRQKARDDAVAAVCDVMMEVYDAKTVRCTVRLMRCFIGPLRFVYVLDYPCTVGQVT